MHSKKFREHNGTPTNKSNAAKKKVKRQETHETGEPPRKTRLGLLLKPGLA